jgi:hypothetical protein
MPSIPFSTATRSRILALAATLLGAASISGVFLGPQPAAMKVAVAGFVLLALWRIGDALVLLAALGPIGGALSALAGSPGSWTTAFVLAVLTGAWLRAIVTPTASEDRPATSIAATWVVLILASAAAECWMRASVDVSPGATIGNLLTWLLRQYPAVKPSYAFLARAIMMAATGAVFAVAVNACRRDAGLSARIARGLVVSAAALGVLAVYRLVEISLRHPPFFESLLEYERSLRVSPIIPDVNAVSALFLLLIPAAAGGFSTRAGRWTAAIALPWLFAGIWLAGSRTALVVIPLAFMVQAWPWLRMRAPATRTIVLGVALLAAVAGVTLLFVAKRGRAYGTVDGAMNIRADMAVTTLRMASSYPLFGVGIGNLYKRSTEFMPEQLSSLRISRDAHNQFLQVLGEMGLTGLFVFCALLWTGLSPGLRATASGQASWELSGYVAGILAFLAVSVGQHPLLMAEVSLALFLLLAVARADGLSVISPGAPRWGWTALLTAVALLACVAVPWRAAALARDADLANVSRGLSNWTRTDGRMWRTSHLPAVIFVPPSGTRITVPLRLRAARGDSVPAIQIRIADRLVTTLQLTNGVWTEPSLAIPPATAKTGRFLRMDFRWAGVAPPTSTLVDIGEPREETTP